MVAACNGDRSQPNQVMKTDSGKQAQAYKDKVSTKKSNCDSTIINNEFSLNPLAFQVFTADTNKIKTLFVNPVVLHLEKNKNEEGDSYFIYNFSDGLNKIILYNNNGFYIQEANIVNNKILLNPKISIGMDKYAFLKLLGVKDIQCNTLEVKNDELTSETIYIFKDAKLSEIKMGNILE